jgi:hypothetical protein
MLGSCSIDVRSDSSSPIYKSQFSEGASMTNIDNAVLEAVRRTGQGELVSRLPGKTSR